VHYFRPVSAAKLSLFLIVSVTLLLPFITGCDFIDQFLGGGTSGGGTTGAPQAVIAAEIDDSMVDSGLNPDLRPPLMYKFNSLDSLDKFGDPIRHGVQEVAWDFGDGETRGFEWNDYVTDHRYWEEGTYTATLTVREPATYGGATNTAQETITIGPAWLEIVSLTTASRPDGQVDVTVVVRNQSQQPLGKIQVDLIANGSIWPSNLSVTFPSGSQDDLPPGGTYTLKSAVGQWTGSLRARSSFCVPLS